MENPRWWDAATAAVVIAMAGLAVVAAADEPSRLWLIAVSLGLFSLGYLLFARPALPAGGWSGRSAAFIACAVVALGVGVAGDPMLATLQAIAFPLVWMLTDSRWQAIVLSGVLACAVLLGFGLGGLAGWSSGIITAVLSFTFAIALGLWITRIVEQGQEKERLVAELTAAQAQVEALSRDRGAGEERERLAREIHDTLAQTLAGLVLLAERAGRQSRAGQSDGAAHTIGTVEQVAREALAEARSLVARTAAVPAEPLLGAAVERLAERFRTETGLRIAVTRTGEERELDREAQVVVLRCLQEALANVRKHARATSVTVRVEIGDDVALTVADDGCGFDVDAGRLGFGLDGMCERVALAHGAFEVASEPGAGTTVLVRLPLPEGTPATGGRSVTSGVTP